MNKFKRKTFTDLGELVESGRRRPVNLEVIGGQVADQRGHRPGLTEKGPVRFQLAAVADGL